MQFRLFQNTRVYRHPVSSEIISLSNNNPFESKLMASSYDRPVVIYTHLFERIKINEKKPFHKTLDVGCGTGISTRALKEISGHVTGIDISEPLLERAMEYPVDPNIKYIKSPGEALPFYDKTFDLVTCCVSFHWLNQPLFLKEAARVLTDNGKLIICNYTFRGLESEEYQQWKKDVFFKNFPIVPAKRSFLKSDQIAEFSEAKCIQYPERFQVTIDQFANLLMSMSAVIEQIEKNHRTISDVRQFLIKELTPFFGNHKTVTFCMDMTVWIQERVQRLDLTPQKTQPPSLRARL